MKSTWVLHGVLTFCTVSIIALATTAENPASTTAALVVGSSERPQPVSYYANPVSVWNDHSSRLPMQTRDLVAHVARLAQIIISGPTPIPSGPTPSPTPMLLTPTPTLVPTATPISPERLRLLDQADLNHDGRIDALDLLLFQSVWLEEVPEQ